MRRLTLAGEWNAFSARLWRASETAMRSIEVARTLLAGQRMPANSAFEPAPHGPGQAAMQSKVAHRRNGKILKHDAEWVGWSCPGSPGYRCRGHEAGSSVIPPASPAQRSCTSSPPQLSLARIHLDAARHLVSNVLFGYHANHFVGARSPRAVHHDSHHSPAPPKSRDHVE